MAMTTETDPAGSAAGWAAPPSRAATPAPATEAPERSCADCGTAIPRRDIRCAMCDRRFRADPADRARTAVNWAIMTSLMLVIFAVGIWYTP